MNQGRVVNLLKTIHDEVSFMSQRDKVTIPIFNPERNNTGAAPWCLRIQQLGKELGWGSFQQTVRASIGLQGSALTWFESWEPKTGHTWESFKADIIALYPRKVNVSKRLIKAAYLNSNPARTYSEYAKKKIAMLRAVNVAFTEAQIIELVSGGIRKADIRSACKSSRSVPDLMNVLAAYDKKPKEVINNFMKKQMFRNKNFNVKNQTSFRYNKCGNLNEFSAQSPRWFTSVSDLSDRKFGGAYQQGLNQQNNVTGPHPGIPRPIIEDCFFKRQNESRDDLEYIQTGSYQRFSSF